MPEPENKPSGRRKLDLPAGDHTVAFIKAIIGLSVLAVSSIVAIFIFRPDQDNTGLISTILGLLVPIITMFGGGALHQLHYTLNSRLSQLVEVSNEASYYKGKIVEKEKAEGSTQ